MYTGISVFLFNFELIVDCHVTELKCADVGEDWIENMFSKKRDELMNYLDEVDEITVASLAPPLRSMTSKFQDVLEEVQIRVERCQIAGAITEKMALLEQKNTRKKNILTRSGAK